jgi:hypothetical protein
MTIQIFRNIRTLSAVQTLGDAASLPGRTVILAIGATGIEMSSGM